MTQFFIEVRDSYLERFPKLAFWIFALLLIFVHVRVFVDFNAQYIDTDQPNLWMAAKDYSKGLFYEPRYYGQAYNTCMESLFAVPLIWAGVPVYYAVPVATHVIFLFPFYFVGFYLYSKKMYWNASIVLGFTLCFPNVYDFLNALPRGFVTGIFFTGFFITSILNPNKLSLIFINTVLAVLAYFVNPNTLIISGPVLFYLFLFNYKRLNYFIVSLLALASYAPFYFLFDYFYEIHPEYIVHSVYFETKLEYFLGSFNNLDERFAHISPFLQNNCIPLLLLFAAVGVLLWKWDKKAFAAFMIFILILLISFSNLRTLDGENWIFFSLSRVYLGIPMALCLLLCVRNITISGRWSIFLCVPILFTAIKSYRFDDSLQQNLKLYRWFHITALKLDDALRDIRDYKKICEENHAEAIFVTNTFWLYCILPYGGPAVDDNYPTIELINRDRRYWVRQDRQHGVFSRFLFLSGRWELEKLVNKTDSFKISTVDYGCIYLVSDNQLTKERMFSRILELENTKVK